MLKSKTFILNPSELTRTRRYIFFLHLMYAYSSTQIFSSPYGGSFRPSCPHGRFLSTAIVHTNLLVHTTVSFTQTFSLHWHSPQSPSYPHRRFLPHTGLTFVGEDIWRLLTFPTNAGFNPLHKNIWRLLDFPTHIEVTSVYQDIWKQQRTSGGYSASQPTQASLLLTKIDWKNWKWILL